MSQENIAVECPSCGHLIAEKFCPNCGEKRIHQSDFSLKHFFEEALDIFTHFDSKFFRSVKAVMLKPGLLSVNFFEGKRKPYMKPLQLFLIVNVIYFLVITYVFKFNTFTTPLDIQLHQNTFYGDWANEKVNEHLKETGLAYEVYAHDFDKKVAVLSKTLIVLFIPIIAIVLYAFFFKKKNYLAEHLVVSTHFFTFFLLMNALLMPLILGIIALGIKLFSSINPNIVFSDAYASTLVLLLIGWYLIRMFLRVYKVQKWYAVTVTALIAYSFFNIIWLYRFILFFVGIHTI